VLGEAGEARRADVRPLQYDGGRNVPRAPLLRALRVHQDRERRSTTARGEGRAKVIHFIESNSTPGVFYRVDSVRGECTCTAGRKGRVGTLCDHRKQVLAMPRRTAEDKLGAEHAELSALVERIGYDAFCTLVVALEDEYGTASETEPQSDPFARVRR
jgi:hypothetical protein